MSQNEQEENERDYYQQHLLQQQQHNQYQQQQQQLQSSIQFMYPNMFYRQIELSQITEEKESKMAQSYMHADLLDIIHFTGNIQHDINILQKALSNLKISIFKNSEMALQHYYQLKEKVDKFFDQQLELKNEDEIKLVSDFCNQINNHYYTIVQEIETPQYNQKKSLSNLENSRFLFKKQSSITSQSKLMSNIDVGGEEFQQCQIQNPSSNNNKNNTNNITINNNNNISPNVSMNKSQEMYQIINTNNNNSFTKSKNQEELRRSAFVHSSPMEEINEFQDEDEANVIQHINESQIQFCEYYSIEKLSLYKGIQIPYTQTYYQNNPFSCGSKTELGVKHNRNNQNEAMTNQDKSNSSVSVLPAPNKQRQHILQEEDDEQQIVASSNCKQIQHKLRSAYQEEEYDQDKVEYKIKLLNNENSNLIKQDQVSSISNNNNSNHNTLIMINDNNTTANSTQNKITPETKNEGNFQAILTKFTQVLELAEYQFHERVIDLAYNSAQDLKQMVTNISQDNTITAENKKHITDKLEQKKDLIEKIEDLYLMVQSTTKILKIKEGWVTEKEKNNIAISYIQTAESPMITLKVEAKVDISIKTLISLVYEVELYTKWMPFCKEGNMLKKIDRSTKVAHLKFNLPIISNREVFLWGAGIDRIYQNGKMLIVVKSIDSDPKFQQKIGVEIPKESKSVRVDVPFFIFEVSPNEQGRGLHVLAIGNFDAKLAFAPNWAVNYVIRKFSYAMFERMLSFGSEKKFKNSEWEKKIKENPEFYEWVDEKYDKYFGKQKNNDINKMEQNNNNNQQNKEINLNPNKHNTQDLDKQKKKKK